MAAAYALIAAALFAAALVTTQFGLRHMDGLAGAKVSVPTATVLLWLLLSLRGFDDLQGWHVQGASVFLALGIFFPVAVTLLAYEANRRMGPTIAGAIGSTAPLFAVLGAVLFLGETLGLSQIAATLAIAFGSIVLVWRGGMNEHSGELRKSAVMGSGHSAGSWVAWLAAALRALAQVIAKAGLLLWPNPYAAVVLGYTVSAVIVWIIAVFSRRPASRAYTRGGMAWFALTGLFNCVAVLALYAALEIGTVNIVSPIAATYPLFTLVLNTLILREERLSARLIGGVALMVGGVVILLAL